MKESEKNMLLVKIQDKYIYDNWFIKGFIWSANAEGIIAKNYVKFRNIIDAYAIGDKIFDALEKMSINPETEMEKNEKKKDMERKRYFDNIRRFANKYDEQEVNKLMNQMRQEQKNEDEKVYH